MSLLKGKYIENDAIDESKILLKNNEWLRAENAAGDDVVNFIKVNDQDQVVLPSGAKIGTEEIAVKSDIPATFQIQGNWNAATNTPELVSSTNDTSVDYPLYIVSVSGSTTIDGQSDWVVGDKIYFANGQWWKADNNDAVTAVNGKSGNVTLDSADIAEGASNFYYTASRFDASLAAKTTDNLSEGSSNLYFTQSRVKSTVLTGFDTGIDDGIQESDTVLEAFEKVQGQIDAIKSSAVKAETESIVLTATDITNGFVTLAYVPTKILSLSPKGGIVADPTTDYSTSADELSWFGDLSVTLEEGDTLIVSYVY
jgi:hypothetical protein